MPWVMKTYLNIVDLNLTYEDFKSCGTRLKLPSGWKYRISVLG